MANISYVIELDCGVALTTDGTNLVISTPDGREHALSEVEVPDLRDWLNDYLERYPILGTG